MLEGLKNVAEELSFVQIEDLIIVFNFFSSHLFCNSVQLPISKMFLLFFFLPFWSLEQNLQHHLIIHDNFISSHLCPLMNISIGSR